MTWFVCSTDKWDRTVWVCADTRGKARHRLVSAMRDSGYKVTYADVKVTRDRSGLPPLPSEQLIP